MVGGYTENLEKPQNCQNWGVGTCAGMGAYLGQYSMYMYIAEYKWLIYWLLTII